MGNLTPTKTLYNDKYIGKWKNDKRHGQGKYTQSTGEIREGWWANNKFTGIGSYRFNNGDSYTGEWKNNKKHGQGKYIQSTGKICEGIWVNDKFTCT
jgi:hypothetical protein